MIEKEFLSCHTIRNNSIIMAQRIQSDGFIPDIIYVSLRGGAYIGNVISEYFKLIPRQPPIFYAAVVARSYGEIRQKDQVVVDGWTYDPKLLRDGNKVLLVDDIFDSGNTVNFLAKTIMQCGIPRDDLKIVVHDYKIRPYLSEKSQTIKPDYFYRQFVVNSAEEESWIHYLSHELVGLTSEEIQRHYSENSEVRTILEKAIPKST